MKRHICLIALATLCISTPAFAAIFAEDFEVDPTANWTVNNGPSDAAADFFFDYSTVGIPAAPGGAGTRGLKLQANLSNGIFSGMSASPNGLNLSGNYTVEFNWWANVNGPFPGGGSGSTNLSTYGIGTSGTIAQWPGAAVQESVYFGGTGDGNSSADWRAYSSAVAGGYQNGDPVFPFASRNSSDPYFAGFGAVSPPAAQTALFPQQTGTTVIGSAGFEWHEVKIEVLNGFAKWYVDNLIMATIDLSTVTLGGGNIFFGHSDINATSSTDPLDAALLFTLIDNINVTPEPTSLSLLALGALVALRRR